MYGRPQKKLTFRLRSTIVVRYKSTHTSMQFYGCKDRLYDRSTGSFYDRGKGSFYDRSMGSFYDRSMV